MTDEAAAGTTGADEPAGAGTAGAAVGAGEPDGRGTDEATWSGAPGDEDEATGATGAEDEAAGVGTRVIVDGTAVTMAGWAGTLAAQIPA